MQVGFIRQTQRILINIKLREDVLINEGLQPRRVEILLELVAQRDS